MKWLVFLLGLASPCLAAVGLMQLGGGSAGGAAPVVQGATFVAHTPVSNGGAVGTATATNSPTSWSITAGDPSGDFAISSGGAITFTAQGATDYAGATNLVTATLTLQATNATGSGTGNNTINAYADGSVNAPGGTAQYPILQDTQKVIALTVTPGSSYTNGINYAWTSSGGGCGGNATGTVDVVSGALANGVISTEGSGCTSVPTIAVPAGAGAGSAGAIVATVLQVRAPWKVAGIDYAVGPQSNPTGDWSTISGTGLSISTTNCWLEITSNNNTLNGYDFTTTHLGCSGITIVNGGTGNTISNCKINYVGAGVKGPPIATESGSGTFTVKYCTIDGGGAAAATSADVNCINNNFNKITLQYNWIKNCPQHSSDNALTGNIQAQWNLWDNCMWYSGAHGDFIQAYSSNTLVYFNSFYQPGANGAQFPGGVVAALNTSVPTNSQTISNIHFDYNVGIGVGATGHLTGPQAMENWVNWTPTGSSDVVQSPTAIGNYVTMVGTRYAVLVYDQPTFGNLGVTTPTVSGNWNMETNSALANFP